MSKASLLMRSGTLKEAPRHGMAFPLPTGHEYGGVDALFLQADGGRNVDVDDIVSGA
jgi:hypothetical protein